MKNINRQTHIFIFELVIAIAFFALASSICVQFFVKAHSLSKETNDINISMNSLKMFLEQNGIVPKRGIDYCQIPFRQR